MKIYTKQGDKGHTQVYADKVLRLSKDDPLLECYGTLDELNAHVGLLNSLVSPGIYDAQLTQVQQNLFQIGFVISAEGKLVSNDVQMLESQIDTITASLTPQTSFVLPDGCQAACQAHVCRTVTRRAERNLVALSDAHHIPPVVLSYINRLSDYFFVLARALNHQHGECETPVI